MLSTDQSLPAPELPLGLLEFLAFRAGASVRAQRDTALQSAVLADRLGYRRCWVPEHHAAGVPSTNPLTWLPVLGSMTTRIRIGSAVSLMRLRDPHLVAEDFGTAAHFCRDRLDVGLGRGDASGPGTEVLTRHDEAATDAAMHTVVSVLEHGCGFVDPVGGTFQRWLNGSGERSARLAGEWGFDYCHALFFNPDLDACLRPLAAYRKANPAGRTAVAVALAINEDPQRAREDGVLRGISVNCIGTAEQGAAMLLYLLSSELIDEVVITEQSTDPADHLAALTRLAELVGRELVGRERPTADRATGTLTAAAV
jgi:alkanesulfonate monooxygenase SsuD/methylene tetrahydromethanopterin reductase-like flavin-dependent oxidoreductase (luciferase family)